MLRGNLMLLLAAFIWGTSFVAQMVGMDGLGPFTYAFSRFLLGFLFLCGLLCTTREGRAAERRRGTYQPGYRAGLGAGIFMLVASALQQYAMLWTTAGKTAFITALYIVLVPLCGVVLLKQRLHVTNAIGGALVLVGLYLLAVQGEGGLGYGDGIVLISTLFWTAQILYIDRYAALVDAIELSVAQIAVCTVGSLLLALVFEHIEIQPILDAWLPIFYGGIMSAGVAFTLQIVGQKYTDPAQAAIFMSFESLFGALGGALLLGEVLRPAQILGCALMFAGLIVTQSYGLLARKRARKKPANE